MEHKADPIPATPRLEEGIKALVTGAVRVASYAHAGVPAEYWTRIRQAIDNGTASLTVQVDLPAATVRVMVDGQGWASPQCLLALKPPEKIQTKLDD